MGIYSQIRNLSHGIRRLVVPTRKRQETVIATQPGHEVAVLLPIELDRQMGEHFMVKLMSPRLTNQDDAARFAMTVTSVDPSNGD